MSGCFCTTVQVGCCLATFVALLLALTCWPREVVKQLAEVLESISTRNGRREAFTGEQTVQFNDILYINSYYRYIICYILLYSYTVYTYYDLDMS